MVSVLRSFLTRVEKSAIGFLNGNRFNATTPLIHLCAMNSSLMGSFCLSVSPPIYIGSFLKGFETISVEKSNRRFLHSRQRRTKNRDHKRIQYSQNLKNDESQHQDLL
ncbi:hypothetical protein IGI04_039440, partial [Brassica rapa subsp. trilocularis]